MRTRITVVIWFLLQLCVTNYSLSTVPERLPKIVILSEGFLNEPRASSVAPYFIDMKVMDELREIVLDCGLIELKTHKTLVIPSIRFVPAKDQSYRRVLDIPFAVTGKYELFVSIRVTGENQDQDIVYVNHLYLECTDSGARLFIKPPEDFGKRVILETEQFKRETSKSRSNTEMIVSVSGRISYADPQLISQPLPEVKVYVSSIFGDNRIALTDGNGYYSVSDWYETPTVISVKIDNGAAFGDGESFFPEVLVYPNVTGNITNADIAVTSEIARMLDNWRISRNFTVTTWGWARGRLRFAFDWGDGVSFYSSIDDRITIYAHYNGATEIWGNRGRELSAHEYGHAVMYSAFGYMPLGVYSGPHNIRSETEPVFAWKEGWAEFFSSAVWPLSVGLSTLALENNPFGSTPYYRGLTGVNADGRIVEGAVATFLWNLFDGVPTVDGQSGDNDDVNVLGYSLWNTFRNGELINSIGQTRHAHSVTELKWLWDDYTTDPSISIQVHAPGSRDVSAVFNKIHFGSPNMPTGALAELSGQASSNRVINLNWTNHYDNVNPPSANLLFRKQVPSNDVWDGTLTGFSQVGVGPYNGTSFQEQVPTEGLFYRYVAATNNSGGDSKPYSSVRVYASRTLNMMLSSATYIEPASGGIYKLNGTNVGSSWNWTMLDTESATIEAIPPSGLIFALWSDGSTQNPRQITPTDHTTLYATFKTHLATGSTSALVNPAQRKIIRLANGYYYACYESAGHIWLTRSTDQGTTWDPEKRISLDEPSGFTNRFPCISFYPVYLGKILCAWEAYGQQGNTWVSKTYCRSYDLATLNYVDDTSVNCLEQTSSTAQFSSKPVVSARLAGTSANALFAWYDPSGTGKVKYKILPLGSQQGSGVLISPGGGMFTLAPNGFDFGQGSSLGWCMAWVASSSTLYYRTFGMDANGVPVFGNIETIASDGGGIGNISLVQTQDYPTSPPLAAVAWLDNGTPLLSPNDPGTTTLRCKQRSTSGWNVPTAVWSVSNTSSPTLTFHSTGGTLSLFWDAAGQIKQVHRSYGSWSGVSTLTGFPYSHRLA